MYNGGDYKSPHEANMHGALHRTGFRINSSRKDIAELVDTLCNCVGFNRDSLCVCYIDDDANYRTIEGKEICEIF